MCMGTYAESQRFEKDHETTEQVCKGNLQCWSKRQIITALQEGGFSSNGGLINLA